LVGPTSLVVHAFLLINLLLLPLLNSLERRANKNLFCVLSYTYVIHDRERAAADIGH
jgi:hypothetical protein